MRDQKGKDLQLGMAALEHARAGGQANVTPEMAVALIERMAYLQELCGRAAATERLGIYAVPTKRIQLILELESAAIGRLPS